MRVKETAEQRVAFEHGVGKWLEIEDRAIAACDKVSSSTDNMLVKTIADAIKSDAVKHKEILAAIQESLTGTVVLSPDDLGAISKLLDDYVGMEKGPVEMAAHEKTSGEHFVVKQLLAYILEDESKYSRFRDEFNEFKKKIYPYGVS